MGVEGKCFFYPDKSTKISFARNDCWFDIAGNCWRLDQ
jgi:hypothetical protein